MCIKRDNMPQIDAADYAGLIAHLNSKHVLVTQHMLPPTWLTVRQCLEETRAARNPLLINKPLLIAMDLSVLDGNHRLLMHLERGTSEVSCFKVDRPFEEACQAILSYQGAYRYGDGPQPYRI